VDGDILCKKLILILVRNMKLDSFHLAPPPKRHQTPTTGARVEATLYASNRLPDTGHHTPDIHPTSIKAEDVCERKGSQARTRVWTWMYTRGLESHGEGEETNPLTSEANRRSRVGEGL